MSNMVPDNEATDFVTDWEELKLEPGTTCRTVFNADGSTEFQYTLQIGDVVAEWSKYDNPPKFKEDASLPFYDINPDSDTPWEVWKKAKNKVVQAVLNVRSGNGKKKAKEGKHTPPAS